MTTPHTEAPELITRLREAKIIGSTLCAEAADRIERLEAALAKAQEDARRYRWLRRKVSAHGVIDGWAFGFPTHLSLPAPKEAMRDPASGLDAAIDAALREAAQPADQTKGEA